MTRSWPSSCQASRAYNNGLAPPVRPWGEALFVWDVGCGMGDLGPFGSAQDRFGISYQALTSWDNLLLAYRRVSVFVGNEIGDLLHGETPDLVLSENGAFWRVPVVLSSRSMGRIGPVGTIDVDVESGELSLSEQLIGEIEAHARRFGTVP